MAPWQARHTTIQRGFGDHQYRFSSTTWRDGSKTIIAEQLDHRGYWRIVHMWGKEIFPW